MSYMLSVGLAWRAAMSAGSGLLHMLCWMFQVSKTRRATCCGWECQGPPVLIAVCIVCDSGISIRVYQWLTGVSVTAYDMLNVARWPVRDRKWDPRACAFLGLSFVALWSETRLTRLELASLTNKCSLKDLLGKSLLRRLLLGPRCCEVHTCV